ncbi:MAG: hypothetical protein MUP97_15075, partial [Acidimicrobiia bacterium]|nr:hypothetical protein [Acidimicrobiia bacterium]
VTRFPDGAWFVDLGPVLDAGFVPAALSAALALPERRQGTLEDSIVAALQHQRLLIVLDNCEQVVDAVAGLVDVLVESCPGLRVLATSREALGVDGETTYPVRPLATPSTEDSVTIDALMENDAIRLFVERARAAKREFVFSNDTAPVVTELCRRLDGIPLAIELAAARLQVMAPAEILARLDERFRLLTGGRRTVLERHQTLRGAIDWSYALLEPVEQLVFRRLAVFAGGFTLDAAEAVTVDGEVETHDVLTTLASLVAKSMVVTDDTAAGTRYRMLDTLREYAWERLGEHDDPTPLHERHAEHLLAFLGTATEQLKGSNDWEWSERLETEQDNLRATLGWARDTDATDLLIRLVHGLWLHWYLEASFREAADWTEVALLHAEDMPVDVRAEILGVAAFAANGLGRVEDAIELGQASIGCSRDAGRPPKPLPLQFLGIAALESNQPEVAIAYCDEAVAAARDHGDTWHELNALQFVAITCLLGGAPERGRQVADELLAGVRRLGNSYLIGQGLFNAGLARVSTEPEVAVELFEEADTLRASSRNMMMAGQSTFFRGVAHLRLRQMPEAAQALRASLRLFQQRDADFFTSTAISMAATLVGRSAPATAAQLLAALERHATESGIPGAPEDIASRQRTRARVEETLGAEAFADAWARGAAMSINEAAALAHDELGKIEG